MHAHTNTYTHRLIVSSHVSYISMYVCACMHFNVYGCMHVYVYTHTHTHLKKVLRIVHHLLILAYDSLLHVI